MMDAVSLSSSLIRSWNVNYTIYTLSLTHTHTGLYLYILTVLAVVSQLLLGV